MDCLKKLDSSVIFLNRNYVYNDDGLAHSPLKKQLPNYMEKHEISE